jgi:hypothetical protein
MRLPLRQVSDGLEAHLATEYDNGRLLKLTLMLNAVHDRAESCGGDAQW